MPVSDYVPVIGLEVHVQLATHSKLFTHEQNSFGTEANSAISAITIAHPGTLPVLNREAIDFAIRLGLALNCELSDHVSFDRKNYFYPDLPKGYQITQDANPICKGGYLDIKISEQPVKSVTLTKIHLEEDAGKSIHDDRSSSTFIDLNRSGVPLLEIVTNPVLSGSDEATSFLFEIRRLVRYLQISDGNMEEGSLRCDANISLHKKGEPLGSKVEVKNMNSFKHVARAIDSEIHRQAELLDQGEEILSETRMYIVEKGSTAPMRTKEMLNDYRYFPEPDVAFVNINKEDILRLKNEMPKLPWAVLEELVSEHKLPVKEAEVIAEDVSLYQFYKELSSYCSDSRTACNWLIGPVKGLLNTHKITIKQFELSPRQIGELIILINEGKLSHSAAQTVLGKLVENPGRNAFDMAQELNLLQERNVHEIVPVIEQVLNENPLKVKEYQNGKKGLIGMFMGKIMQKSQGKIDPKLTNSLLVEKLNTFEI